MPDEIEFFDGIKDDILRVVNDHGFMNTFLKRAAHEYWFSVIYIQTNIKSKHGCGTPIVVKFYAPIDMNNLDAEIVYDFRALGTDAELARSGDDYAYCLK